MERGQWSKVKERYRQMMLRVQTYSGYKADERPVRITLGERTLEVTCILDRWYAPGSSYFKIVASDENTYILQHRGQKPHEPNERNDAEWLLVSYREGHEPGRGDRGG